MSNGLDIHLFVEYVSRYGDENRNGLRCYVNTILGKSCDVANDYELNERHRRMHIIFNTIVESLTDKLNMFNTRISVTVFHTAEMITLQDATDDIVLLNRCADESTFAWKGRGKIPVGYGMSSVFNFNKLREHILKLKSEKPDRKHLVLFVSELFPASREYEERKVRDFFKEWKKDDVEFITLRLNNSNIVYNTLDKFGPSMNYKLYQELSTVPEWTYEGNYEKICFLLSLIGQKLSNMNFSEQSLKLGQLVKDNPAYQLDKEVKAYDQKTREESEKEQRRRNEEHEQYMQILDKQDKQKIPLAYVSVIAAAISIILCFNRKDLCLLFTFISLVSGFIGKGSSKRGISILGIVLGIISVFIILTMI